jgi:hypothetical protein
MGAYPLLVFINSLLHFISSGSGTHFRKEVECILDFIRTVLRESSSRVVKRSSLSMTTNERQIDVRKSEKIGVKIHIVKPR